MPFGEITPVHVLGGGGILTSIMAALALWRRFSKTRAGVSEDNAEVSMLKTYREEVERLIKQRDEAQKSANDSARQLGELTAKVDFLTTQNQEQTIKIKELESKIDNQTQQLTALLEELRNARTQTAG